MAARQPKFDFTLVLSNDRMGFRRRFEVTDALMFENALDQARMQLREKGYNPDDFDVVSVERKAYF